MELEPIGAGARSGEFVALFDEPTGGYEVARWSREAGAWVRENGDPAGLEPTHWTRLPQVCASGSAREGTEARGEAQGRVAHQAGRQASRKMIGVAGASMLVVIAITAALGFGLVPFGGREIAALVQSGRSWFSRLHEPGAAFWSAPSLEIKQASAAPFTQGASVTGALSAAIPVGASPAEPLQATAAVVGREAAQESGRGKFDALAEELSAARETIRALEARSAAATSALQAAETAARAQEAAAREAAAAMERERERADALARQLAAANLIIEALKANARSVISAERDALEAMRSAEAVAAERTDELRQERERSAALARQLAAAQEEGGAIRARAEAAAAEIADVKAAYANAVAAGVEQANNLELERTRAKALASEIAAVRAELAELKAGAASTGAAALEQTQVVARERERADALSRELMLARQELKFVKDQAEALLRDRDRAARLASEVSSAREEAEALRVRLAALEAGQSADKASRDPAGGNDSPPPASMSGSAQVATSPRGDVARALARGEALVRQGDIKGARLVLERVQEAGDPHAAFALAETYDPRMLATWRTYGVRADVAKARELYARAYAGGIRQAAERKDSLK